jgi:hypothetical protein
MKIGEIRAYFEGLEIPKEEIRLTSGEVVVDVAKMVDSHIETLTENAGKRLFLPYYERLLLVTNHIKNKQINEKSRKQHRNYHN